MVCIDIRLVSKDAHDTYVRITGLPYAMGKMDQILGIKVYHYFFGGGGIGYVFAHTYASDYL